jgi:cell division protein FtsW (lipid II flippase)
VSYGGSSRVASFVMIALLVRISAGPWQPATRRAE